MSLNMQDLQQHPIIKFGQKKVGRPCGIAASNKLPSQLPELVGKVFNNLIITTGEIIRKKSTRIEVQCLICKKIYEKDYHSVMAKKAGCGRCGNLKIGKFNTPKWLVQRCISAQQRCCNPNDQRYKDYGGRGVSFNFSTPTEMAVYIQDVLGLQRELQIDRINNNLGYQPGNLRYVTPIINANNQRGKRATAKTHAFRIKHPNIKYADKTLVRFFHIGMTDEEIIDRYYNVKSIKPKGVFGTFEMQDQEIALLSQGY